jgi:predicted porin
MPHLTSSSLSLALLAAVFALPASAAMLEVEATNQVLPEAAAPSWMFVDGAWGRIEIGRNPDDANTVGIDLSARPAMSDTLRLSGIAGLTEPSGERSRVSYFTPRFMGLQAGASVTPDAGARGDGALALALGYRDRIGALGVNLGGEVAGGNAAAGAWGLGGRLSMGAFELGAGYQEFGASRSLTAGAADRRFDIGLGVSGTSWQLSAGFAFGWARGVENDGPVGMLSLAGGYTPAAGWDLRADLNFVELRSTNPAAGEARSTGAVVTISSILKF